MEQETRNIDEMVELEEERPAGPRWAEVQQESVRSQRADVAALWCRRVAGLLVWGFVGIIISQLWTVAWKLKDLKLLALCLLITASLLYIFYKRYRHIREIGLTGVDLVRAMTVDDGENGGLHGVTRKARASCVDFKFDPHATFQERPLGRGFEPYPPPIEATGSASSSNSPGGGVGEDDDAKAAERKRRRGITSWLSCWGRNDLEASRDEASTSTNSNLRSTASASAGTPPSIAIVAVGEELRIPSCGKDASFDDLEMEHLGISTAEAAGAGEGAEVGAFLGAVTATATSGTAAATGHRWAGETGVGHGARGGQVVRACELNPSCCVCLFEYYLDEEVTLLPCGHLYHTECIDIWMSDHVDCPYCRADINVWATVGGGAAAAAAAGAGPGDCPNRSRPAIAPAPPDQPSPPSRSATPNFPAAVAVASSIAPHARPATPTVRSRSRTETESRESSEGS